MGGYIFNIKKIEFIEWERIWPYCYKNNLLQSWFYGEVKRKTENIYPTRFIISNGTTPVALVQILLKKIPFFGTVARINRGPILVRDFEKHPEEKLMF